MCRRLVETVALMLLALAGSSKAEIYVWPVNGHLYEPVALPAGITWTAANAAAVSAGGYLATLTNAEENAFVYDLIADDDSFWNEFDYGTRTGPWLGGFQPPNSPEPDGGWQWVTGEPWGYTNWAAEEPNNGAGTEHYLHFYAKAGVGVNAPTWNDNTDNGAKPVSYVVEYDGAVGTEAATWGRIKALFR